MYRLVSVSGRILRLVDDNTLPQVDPIVITAGHPVTVPPRSFGFIVIPDAQAAACLSWTTVWQQRYYNAIDMLQAFVRVMQLMWITSVKHLGCICFVSVHTSSIGLPLSSIVTCWLAAGSNTEVAAVCNQPGQDYSKNVH